MCTHSPTHILSHSLTHPLTYSLDHSLTYSLTHPLTHSLTHTLNHPPSTHSPPPPPHTHTHSGGTIYTIEGNNLQTPQIRNLVFYMDRPNPPNKRQINQRPTSPASHTKRQQSPPPRPDNNNNNNDNDNDNDNNMKIMVPKPRLSDGMVTECVETWDFISEVD